MRRHATAVSTRWILRYLRVDDSWGASVARDAARALASTVSTARAAKNARLTSSGFAHLPQRRSRRGAGSPWVRIERNMTFVRIAADVVVERVHRLSS